MTLKNAGEETDVKLIGHKNLIFHRRLNLFTQNMI